MVQRNFLEEPPLLPLLLREGPPRVVPLKAEVLGGRLLRELGSSKSVCGREC
jgi:hypothetical protein